MSTKNCAGQACPERTGCKRFEVRTPARTIEIADKHIISYDWASFDIERMVYRVCPHRIQWHAKEH